MSSRMVQLIALVVMVAGTTACGRLLSPILKRSDEAGLRYTDVSVEGAPPYVVLGTAVGALRGLIVDVLWIKVHYMQEQGLFYEVMADADLITKLQPRFAQVWAFHGHNMAYNISVTCNTQEERWKWVNAGIRLVREKGLRYNPNDLVLHKELAFWFAHKIEGVADDAHLYYKRKFAEEWHYVLGEPPPSYEQRIAWIKEIADAALSIDEAESRTPGVKALIDRINSSTTPLGEAPDFHPNLLFLYRYGQWQAINEQSEAAKLLGLEQQYREENPYFAAFDEIARDPDLADQWKELVLFVRKRVLIDEYNMDPELMYEFTRDLGPIDWRHGQAHALYWSRLGSIKGETRVSDDEDIYKMINNDRMQLQAMQGLARYGRITFDPLSTELPSRFPDPRWIDVINDVFPYFYSKYYDARGAGGDTFIAFLQNFMASAIREAYRSGEFARAQRLYDSLIERFGVMRYPLPIDVFVKKEIEGEIEFQPHIAPSEAVASMRYAFRIGVGRDRPEVWDQAVTYTRQMIDLFKENESNDYYTRFATGRMRDLMKDLGSVQTDVLLQLMTDPTIQFEEKLTIWGNLDKFAPRLRLAVYDRMAPVVQRQLQRHELGQKYTFAQLFPEPPGFELYRQQRAAEKAEEAQRTGGRDPSRAAERR
jgi:hypothetical protein